MTLILTESFDGATTLLNAEYLDAKHGKMISGLSSRQGGCYANNTNSAVSITPGRHGSCLRLLSQSATADNAKLESIFESSDEDDVVILGIALNGTFGSTTIDGIFFSEFRNVSGVGTRIDHVKINPNSASSTNAQLDVKNAAGTTVASFQGGLTTLWKYLEVKVKIHDTAGTIEVRIDGVTVVNLTGQDTRNNSSGATGVVNCIAICNSSGTNATMYIDDMYILNEQGSSPFNDFLGDVTIQYLQPNAAGTNTNWTPSSGAGNWDHLSDPVTTAPAITDYISSSTTDQKDTYNIDNLSYVSPNSVLGIINYAYADKVDTGLRTLALVTKLSGNETQTGDLQLRDSGNGGAQYLKQVLQTKPGGGSWTIDDVNAMEIGVVCRP